MLSMEYAAEVGLGFVARDEGTSEAARASGDLAGVGLFLALAGVLLLANVVLFRHPRTLVADFLGVAPRRLSTLREHLFRRVQVTLGFVLLAAGLFCQLYAHVARGASEAGSGVSVPWLYVGLLAFLVVALEVALWFGSRALYRRYLREHFLANPPDLESDLGLARELGELYGVASREGDSVQSFLFRIRHEIGLPAATRPRRESGRAPVAAEVEEEYEPSP
jgi:hypothetical protein